MTEHKARVNKNDNRTKERVQKLVVDCGKIDGTGWQM